MPFVYDVIGLKFHLSKLPNSNVFEQKKLLLKMPRMYLFYSSHGSWNQLSKRICSTLKNHLSFRLTVNINLSFLMMGALKQSMSRYTIYTYLNSFVNYQLSYNTLAISLNDIYFCKFDWIGKVLLLLKRGLTIFFERFKLEVPFLYSWAWLNINTVALPIFH